MSDLKILRGSPVPLSNGLFVHPLKLGDIENLGEELYNLYVSLIRINKDIVDKQNLSPIEKITLAKQSSFDFFMDVIKENKSWRDGIFEGLRLFIREKIHYDEVKNKVYFHRDKEFLLLNENLWIEIKNIIEKQNFIQDSGQSYSPANKKATELLNRLNEIKQKHQEKLGVEAISLSDVISLVASHSKNFNIVTIWDLTVNQLYLEYYRMIKWDAYHNDYIHLPHMSEQDRKNLEHWVIGNNKIKL